MNIQQLEEQRQKFKKDLVLYIIYAISFFVLIIIVSNIIKYELHFLALFLIAFLGYNWYDKYKIYEKNYNSIIVAIAIKESYPNSNYLSTAFIKKEIFDDSNIFKSDYNVFTGDSFTQINDFGNLTFSELYVENRKSKNSELIFNGVFGFATFPFNFEGFTVLLPNTLTTFNYRFNSLEKVTLESPRFMEKWDVLSDSQIGARMALNTDIMSNLLYLHDELNCEIRISFRNNKVFFALTNAGFSPNIVVPIQSQYHFKKLKQQIQTIQKIVNTFKLYQA
jgi:Protein of unknown function (DUF3137)